MPRTTHLRRKTYTFAMASPAIPSSSSTTRAAAILCLFTLLLTFLPCFASAASAVPAHPQTGMSAGQCASCCKGPSTLSAQALCCEAHPQPAQPTAARAIPSVSLLACQTTVPASIPSTAAPISKLRTQHPRPPLLTVLRI